MATTTDIQEIWKKQQEFYSDTIQGININDAQPGLGKTYNFVEEVEKNPDKTYIFFSSIHAHLDRVEQELKKRNIDCLHWEGFTRLCKRYPKNYAKTPDQIFVKNAYDTFPRGARTLCPTCQHQKSCKYREQFRTPAPVVLAPLEFLFLEAVKGRYDRYYVDECVNKLSYSNWSFSAERLAQYINVLEDIEGNTLGLLRIFEENFLDIHQEFLKQTSLIFTRPPKELLDFDRNTYKKKDGFLQINNLVTHWGTINISPKKHYRILFDEDKRKSVRNCVQHIIRESFKKGRIYELTENFSSIEEWFDFLDCIITDTPKRAIAVSETIDKKDSRELTQNQKDSIKILEQSKKWDKGFIGKNKPFLYDKEKDVFIISNIGKEYSSQNTKNKKDSWLTTAQPFTYKVFELAQSNHIVMLDATYNKKLFEKDKKLFENTRAVSYGVYSQQSVPANIEINRINLPRLVNKKSTLYKIGNGNYPKATIKREIPTIKNNIKKIMKQIKGQIGIISVKKAGNQDVKQQLGRIADKTLHYFNQRGKNDLDDVDILFLVGTPYVKPKQIPFEYVLRYGKIPENLKTTKQNNKFMGYENPILHELLRITVLDEIYHAIHRCRPLRNDRKIYCYCRIPERIKDEVKYESIKAIPLNAAAKKLLKQLPYVTIMNRLMKSGARIKWSNLHAKVRGLKAIQKYDFADLVKEFDAKGYIKVQQTKSGRGKNIKITDKGRKWYENIKKEYKNKGIWSQVTYRNQ